MSTIKDEQFFEFLQTVCLVNESFSSEQKPIIDFAQLAQNEFINKLLAASNGKDAESGKGGKKHKDKKLWKKTSLFLSSLFL